MNDKPLTALHKAAREYASRGLPIFPIRPNGKEPASINSFDDATTDLRQVDAWWGSGDFNIGLEPERMGWAVVDVDFPEGDTAAFPYTFRVETPSGGSHLYYAGSVAGSVRKLGPGLDTRGRRSYVLVPPSVVNDRPYTAPFFPPDDYDVAPLPDWVAAAVETQPVKKRTAPADVELDKPLAIAQAQRLLCNTPVPVEGSGSDDATYRAASRLKDFGITEETALNLLGDWSGFDREWLEGKIANVYHYGQNELGSDVPRSAQEKFGAAAEILKETIGDSVTIAKGKGGRPQRIEWLWQDWLPRGKLTILSGEKGVGKSTVCYHVLATITRGGKWPDGTSAPVGDILIWSAEDDWADTILPRLMVAGADFEHVFHVEGVKLPDGGTRTFDPAKDMMGLLAAAEHIPNLAAVLIDPVVSAVAGDSHKNAETRRGLQPLVDFAGARKAAVIGITHFSKNTQGRSPLDRINGSLAFGAIARMVWGAVKSDDDSAPRRLVRIATNISEWGGGFDYTLHRATVPGEDADFVAQGLAWGSFVAGNAGAQIAEVQGGEEGTSKAKEAEAFLHMMLPDGQMVEVADIKRAAEAHCIAAKTLLNAKRALGVIAKQRPGAAAAVWCWRLPPRESSAELEY